MFFFNRGNKIEGKKRTSKPITNLNIDEITTTHKSNNKE